MSDFIALGKQGLLVPKIGLGCMGMSEFYGDADQTESLNVLKHAHDIGCRFWDTSDIYGPHTNEELLSKALKNIRADIILATKFGILRNADGEWLGVSGRPDYVRQSCEASLKRLGTDYIDLYYQHRMDPEVPIEDTVGELSRLVEEGKIRYIGLSEAEPELIRRAHAVHPVTALQTEYSLWSRDVETEILPCIRELGIGFVSYSPIGRGFLSGVLQKPEDLAEGDWRQSNPRFQKDAMEHNRGLLDTIHTIAEVKSVTAAQIALAWVIAQGSDIFAIPGTKRQHYLEQNWNAQTVELNDVELNALDTATKEFVVQGTRY